MFLTVPQLAVPFPPALAPAGTKFWRAFHLTFPHPWFIATFQSGEGDEALCATWVMASDADLFERVNSPAEERLVGLVCMVPPLGPPSTFWSARKVNSIWFERATEGGPTSLVFRDSAGLSFAAGLRVEPVEPTDHHQLFVDLAAEDGRQV
jgi:hypothetical protein